MNRFPKINVAEYELNRVQDNVEITFNQILGKQILDGILIKNITLTSGVDNIVNHGLARQPEFVIIGAPSAEATVWNTLSNNKYIVLRSSANCTVSVWTC